MLLAPCTHLHPEHAAADAPCSASSSHMGRASARDRDSTLLLARKGSGAAIRPAAPPSAPHLSLAERGPPSPGAAPRAQAARAEVQTAQKTAPGSLKAFGVAAPGPVPPRHGHPGYAEAPDAPYERPPARLGRLASPCRRRRRTAAASFLRSDDAALRKGIQTKPPKTPNLFVLAYLWCALQ